MPGSREAAGRKPSLNASVGSGGAPVAPPPKGDTPPPWRSMLNGLREPGAGAGPSSPLPGPVPRGARPPPPKPGSSPPGAAPASRAPRPAAMAVPWSSRYTRKMPSADPVITPSREMRWLSRFSATPSLKSLIRLSMAWVGQCPNYRWGRHSCLVCNRACQSGCPLGRFRDGEPSGQPRLAPPGVAAAAAGAASGTRLPAAPAVRSSAPVSPAADHSDGVSAPAASAAPS